MSGWGVGLFGIGGMRVEAAERFLGVSAIWEKRGWLDGLDRADGRSAG